MNHVAALLERDDDPQVVAAAEAVAGMLGADVERVRLGGCPASARAATALQELAADGVVAGAISAHGPDPVCWDVIKLAPVPLVVIPRDSDRTLRGIHRMLLPLDGSPEAAAGVSGWAQLALDTGASVVAMHVFDASTVPAFWDQAAHSHQQWTREFLRRNLPHDVQLHLSRGRPALEVLAEADRTGVDLIVLGWGQNLATGRAATVRQALTSGLVPVLLAPTGPGTFAGPDRDLAPS